MRFKVGQIAVASINIYQRYVRIALPHSCRFDLSCSEYTKEAILKYGFLYGLLKGTKRIFICHPLSGRSGYDPLE